MKGGDYSAYFTGKVIANIILSFVRVGILALVGWFLTGIYLPLRFTNIAIVLLSIILGTSVWVSAGFICGVFINREDMRDLIFTGLTLPLTFASSIYYNIEIAPVWVRWISHWNPITFSCNLLRKGFLLDQPEDFSYDLAVLFIYSSIFLSLAFVSSRKLSV